MEEMGLASRCCSSGAAQELHVLAVDDSVVDRTFIERLLKISCCKVTAVESGRMALQYLGLDGEKSRVGLDGLKVNLILTDYSMPGMTGYELLKKIKGSSALRKIPVVIMSSENILARIDRCLEEGAEDFLVKPVKLSDVKRIKDFVLREGEENGRKEDFVSKAGEKNEMRETRKRKYDVPLSPNQPESASPSSPTCDLPASTKSSSAALHSTPSLLDNAVDQSLACDPASLPESSLEASQELHSTRPRLGNAADSW